MGVILIMNNRYKLKKEVLQEAVHGELTTQDADIDGWGADVPTRIANYVYSLGQAGKVSAYTKPLSPNSNEPFELPYNWVWVQLGDLANITVGYTPAKKYITTGRSNRKTTFRFLRDGEALKQPHTNTITSYQRKLIDPRAILILENL